jgi:hypothetical protein
VGLIYPLPVLIDSVGVFVDMSLKRGSGMTTIGGGGMVGWREYLGTLYAASTAHSTATYGIWHMVYGIWYMVYGIWYMVYGIEGVGLNKV